MTDDELAEIVENLRVLGSDVSDVEPRKRSARSRRQPERHSRHSPIPQVA